MTPLSKQARIAGFIYLLLVFVAPLRLIYIPNTLFVKGDAATTMANMAAHETLFRLGMMANLVAATILIFLVLALYRLFEGVDKQLATMVVLVGGVMPATLNIMEVGIDATALAFATNAEYLRALDPPVREALGFAFLRLNGSMITASELLWGLWLFPLALLTWRSGFLPKFLAVWLGINGVAYLVMCGIGVLAPQHSAAYFDYSLPATLGEVAFVLWLVIRGAEQGAQEPAPAVVA